MADYDSDDDEAYFLDLVFRSADERDILERVREHETLKQFRAHAEKGYSRLTADQIDKALDLNVVKWSQFHLKVMQSVTDNRVSNKTNASRRSISHTNTCTELKAKLCENYVEFVTEEMGNDWRSVVQTFACLFIHDLNAVLMRLRMIYLSVLMKFSRSRGSLSRYTRGDNLLHCGCHAECSKEQDPGGKNNQLFEKFSSHISTKSVINKEGHISYN